MTKNLFCSECGSPYDVLEWPRTCKYCGFVQWQSPVPVAAIIQPISDNNRTGVLILRRAIEPQLGEWSLPGGFMENNGESAEQGAMRELYEETNIKLKILPKIISSTASATGRLIIMCESEEVLQLNELDIKLCAENSDYRIAWEFEELAFPIHSKAMKEWFDRQQKLVDNCDDYESNKKMSFRKQDGTYVFPLKGH